MRAKVVAPSGRRRLWRVEVEGWYEGYIACDSEAIAREVAKRLRDGRKLGWVAQDLRKTSDSR